MDVESDTEQANQLDSDDFQHAVWEGPGLGADDLPILDSAMASEGEYDACVAPDTGKRIDSADGQGGDSLPAVAMPSLGSDSFSQHMNLHLARAQRQSLPKLPWQTSPIFNVFSPAHLQPPGYTMLGRAEAMQGPTPSRDDASGPRVQSTPEFVARRLRMTSLAQSEESIRRCILLKARTLILFDPPTTQLGSSLLTAAGTLTDESMVAQSFSDSFAPKATSTLVKRMSSLWRYAKWCTNQRLSPLHVTEPVVYRYLCWLREEHAAPTAASNFVEALRFLHGVVFIKSMSAELTLSGRCRGLAREQLQRKQKRRQAPPLSKDMVLSLEKYVMEHFGCPSAVVAGHLLFCVCSGARWGDALWIDNIVESHQGRITLNETATSKHKSAISDEAKTTLLPYIWLGQGLCEEPWSTSWLNSRVVCKVGTLPQRVAMPSWSDSLCKFLDVPMSSTEATIWLHEILERCHYSERQVSVLSSHSLKTTLLSWAAKSGMFTRGQRRLLGHHYDPEDRSMLVYSRDAYTSLAVSVRLMLDRIISGRFNPDLPRVQRVAMAVEEAAEDPNESESSSPSSSTSSGTEPPSPSTQFPGRDGPKPAAVPGIEEIDIHLCMVHRTSGVIHISANDRTFRCGRTVTSNYSSVSSTSFEPGDLSTCLQCSKPR